jgi:hypothetical protein
LIDEKVQPCPSFSALALILSSSTVWRTTNRRISTSVAREKKRRIMGGGYGINWEELDEDISVRGLLRLH